MLEKKKRARAPGNPQTSDWFSTPQANRLRPKVGLTLSVDAIETLRDLARAAGESLSATVERLILRAKKP